jgi:hypothetical protein
MARTLINEESRQQPALFFVNFVNPSDRWDPDASSEDFYNDFLTNSMYNDSNRKGAYL